jgi:hypothetical protein
MTFATFFLLSCAFSTFASSSSLTFPPNGTNLSNDTYQAHYPWVANVGSHVYVSWTEGAHGIYFRSSPNNGTTWNPPTSSPALRISNPGGTAQYPIVVGNANNVYVTWSQSVKDSSGSFILQIYFAASSNYGLTFSKAVQLTSGYSPNGFITPVMAAGNSNVYIAYTANGKNSYVVWSNDNGTTWSGPYHYAITHEPQIAASGNNAYVIADGVQMAVTNNAGKNWMKISNQTDQGDEPWIVASGQYVYVVSQTKTASGTIHFFYSNNYGKLGSWTPQLQSGAPKLPGISISGSLVDTWEPQIAVSGNALYVTFRTLKAPFGNWVVTSNNNGKSWTAPVELTSGSSAIGWATQIAASGSYSYTIWPQVVGGNNWEMFVAATTNNGGNWNSLDVSNNPGTSGPTNDIATSSIAANYNHAFAVWQDNSTGNYQILLSISS